MNEFGERLKNIRKQKGMTQSELGNLLGASKQVISRYENGERAPKLSVAFKYANKLGVSILELMPDGKSELPAYDNIFPIHKHKVPILGDIACGEPIFAEESFDGFISCEGVNADFALRCKGDSMINARIYDGDIVFVQRQSIVNNGEIAVVIIEDEATLKRVYYNKNNNTVMLCPENNKYQPFMYKNEELDNIRILGKAVAFQSVIK